MRTYDANPVCHMHSKPVESSQVLRVRKSGHEIKCAVVTICTCGG